MAEQPKRRERRQVNVSVSQDKRKSTTERRHCPDCNGPLEKGVKRVAGGSVGILNCPKCGWSQSARATDADVLLLKMSWALDLQTKGGHVNAVLPPELSDALKLKSGDQLVISPLTSPVGSLPMKWSLSVKRAKA
jgi:ribosomal protein L37AE/L43A